MFTVDEETVVLAKVIGFHPEKNALGEPLLRVDLENADVDWVFHGDYYDQFKQAMNDYLDGQHVDVTVKSKEN